MKVDSQPSILSSTSQDSSHQFTPISQQQINQAKLWEQALQNLKCSKDHQAIMLCCSQKCNQQASVCGVRKCPCKKQHLQCHSYVQFDNLIEVLKKKTIQKSHMTQQIEQFFDQLIDKLSDIREKVIAATTNVFFSPQLQIFIDQLNNFSLNEIKGQFLNTCSFGLNSDQIIQKDYLKFNGLQNHLKNFVEQLRIKMAIFQRKLVNEGLLKQNSSSLNKSMPQVCKIDSEIMTSEQVPVLRNFFPGEGFKEANLLYRASQNNYRTQKFWQSCSNIPNTLVLILTQKHKVIGGYTPQPWIQYNRVHPTSDQTLQSFIFSLTEQEKFTLKNAQNATYYINSSWGPQFGIQNRGDLSISDRCNVEERSFCFCGNEYTSEKNQGQKVDLERFVGENSQYFRIVDWEVFQLIF